MIGLSALLTSCITPRGQLADRRQPTVAGRRLLQCQQFAGALLHHALQPVGFGAYLLLQARALGDVALHGDRPAHPAVRVVQRIRVHLDDGGRATSPAPHLQDLATHALAAQRAGGGMLVHEQRGAVERARAVELPQLAQRLRLRLGMLELRLCIRAHRAAVGIHHAHRVGEHVEDRFQLGHAARQVFTQLLALRHVAAGKQHAARTSRIDERHERGFHQAATAAMLEGHAHRHHRCAPRRDVHLLREVGQRVGEGIVDRPPYRLARIKAGEVPVTRIGCHQRQRAVEHGERQGHRFEQRIEARSLGIAGMGSAVEAGK